MACHTYQEENPTVRAQLDANTKEINSLNELKSSIQDLINNGLNDCKSYLDCCYNNVIVGLSGPGLAGCFDNINNYYSEVDTEISNLNTSINNITSEITRLETENISLNKKLYVTKIHCDIFDIFK